MQIAYSKCGFWGKTGGSTAEESLKYKVNTGEHFKIITRKNFQKTLNIFFHIYSKRFLKHYDDVYIAITGI